MILAAQDPRAVADRRAVVRDAMALGLQLEPAILGCSVTEQAGAGHRTTMWSGELALGLDSAQYAANDGPCLSAARSGTVHLVAGSAAQARYPRFAAAAQQHGVRSSLSMPLIGSPRPAALNFYAAAVTTLSEARTQAAAGLLARCLGRVLNDDSLDGRPGDRVDDGVPTAAVDAALARRAQIRRAQDTLTAQRRVGRDDALSVLMQRSRQEIRSIHDVAEEVCGGAGTEAAS
jgi:hypothetical protein